MRGGWPDWLIGILLAIWAVGIPWAFFEGNPAAMPWPFAAIYVGLAIVLAIVLAVFLRRGWGAFRLTPPTV
jgi:hypothetical protein